MTPGHCPFHLRWMTYTYDVAVTSSSLTGTMATDTTTAELVIDTTPPEPVLVIDRVTEDNILNSTEASSASFLVTGTVTGEFLENDTVTLTVDGTDYSGTVDASGTYSVEIPTSELAENTLITGVVETIDQAGNEGSGDASRDYQVDVVAPQVSGQIQGSGNEENVELAGTSDEPEGSTVAVTNGDGDVICSTTLDADRQLGMQCP